MWKNIAKLINLQGFMEKYENYELFMDEDDEDCGFYMEYTAPICNSSRMGVCDCDGSATYLDQFKPDKII